MTTEIKFNPSLAAAVAAQGTVAEEKPLVQQEKHLAPILGGDNVRVKSGAMTDLEKLVARIKSEDDQTRTNLTRMRLAAVMTALDTASVRLTQEQATAFADLTEQQATLGTLEAELAQLYAAYGIGAGDDASAVMEAKIKSLEQAVERAIQEGKDHNEAVAKAKEQLAREQAELDKLENAEVKDEAAIAAAQEAVANAQGAYDAATAVAAGDAKAISDAQSALAKAKTDAARIPAVQAGIGEATAKIAADMAVLGTDTMKEIAAALGKVAEGAEQPEARTSEAEREKEEEKKIAFDPLNAIRDALDKIDAAILQTIDENLMLKA